MSAFSARISESENSLLQRAGTCADFPTVESLNAEKLRQITEHKGIDFATALLFDRFQKSSRHMDFIRRINTLRQSPSSQLRKIDAKLVIIPGALYVERPDLGGDGRLIREVAHGSGWRTDLVPLASRGSILENAGLLKAWLAQHSGEKVILVSLSKGGAELKMALNSTDASRLFQNVVAWINVCGPLNGSRMVDWVLASRIRKGLLHLQYRLQRRDFRFITQLRHTAPAPLAFPLLLPAGMKMVSLIGFPLRRHMTTAFSRFCHKKLAANGPNDGTISLSDLCDWPGEIYPSWGTDHYFRPETMARELIAAVLRCLD